MNNDVLDTYELASVLMPNAAIQLAPWPAVERPFAATHRALTMPVPPALFSCAYGMRALLCR